MNVKTVVIKQFSPKFKILEPSVKKTFKGLRGGRGGGKGWAIARKLIDLSMKYRFDCVCARAYWTNIEESSYKVLLDTIISFDLEDQFKITDTYIQNKHTGAMFTFCGLNTHPKSIKSREFKILWVDEGEQITEEAWDNVIYTVIRKKGCTVFCSWNRLLPTTHVEKIFNPETNPDCVVEEINYWENPYLPESFIQQAELMRVNDYEKWKWIFAGGFQPTGTSSFIDLQDVMNAFDRGTPPCADKAIVAGLDLGYSRDRSVLTIRQGLRILDVKIWRTPNHRQLLDEVIGICNHQSIQGIGVDKLGVGAPMVSDLTDALGTSRVFPIGYGDSADDTDQYTNKRTEAWGKIKEWLQLGHIPSGINNDWITDLCNIRYSYDTKGKLQIEQKKLYVGRGFSSTDMADSLGISLCVPDKLPKVGTITSKISSRPYLDLGY